MDIPRIYHEWSLWVGATTGLSDAILHIHAGLIIMLLVRGIGRISLASFIPFWFVVAAELANEVLDYLAYGLDLPDILSDVGYTLFWPLVISLALRLRPLKRVEEKATAATGDPSAMQRPIRDEQGDFPVPARPQPALQQRQGKPARRTPVLASCAIGDEPGNG